METPFELGGRRVWVAGHRGMVGSAVVRRLQNETCEILTADHRELDLLRQAEVEFWLKRARPDAVIVAAARVGGIHANNSMPGTFLYENLAIETNVIHASYRAGVKKLLFLGSSCIYPRLAEQPMREDALLTGALEPTNEWYAVAKIAGLKMCQAYRRQYGCDFISAMPTNLYGPNDNYDLETGHVPAALMVKLHEAKTAGRNSVEIWGTGAPLREFMHVDDLADALVFMLKHYSAEEHLNVGTGKEISIHDFAKTMARVIGYEGSFTFNSSKPDGAPRKLMDSARIHALGWRPQFTLEEGLADAYKWFVSRGPAATRDGPEAASRTAARPNVPTPSSRPVIVLQMGKVGSKSLKATLQNIEGVEVFHIHQINADKLQAFIKRRKHPHKALPEHIVESLTVIDSLVDTDRPLEIVTCVRDPLERNVSAFFNNINHKINRKRNEERYISKLAQRFINKYPHRLPLQWFDLQLKEPLGLDIYQHALNFDKGYSLIEHGRVRLLVVRCEDSDEQKAEGIRNFLGLSGPVQIARKNSAEDKKYSATYRMFKERFSPGAELLDKMYRSQFCEHFYSAAEIDGFYAKWRGD